MTNPKRIHRGIIFWAAGVCGAGLFALLVWMGFCLRSPPSLEPAIRSDADTSNKFIKYLIKPPQKDGAVYPAWLKDQPDSGLKGLVMLPLAEGFDSHLAQRLAEEAARTAQDREYSSEEGDHVRSIFANDDIKNTASLRLPSVTLVALRVQGKLSKKVVRRILRRHLGEMKYCHARALKRDPDLHGRIAVKFTIASTGQVIIAKIESTSLNRRDVHSCVTRGIKRWLFPPPKENGIVIVSSTFEFAKISRGGGPRPSRR